MAFLIGLDISTTGAKAILLDTAGKVVQTATSVYPLSTPKPLWSEQNPHDWWQGAKDSLQSVLQTSGADPKDVIGIGLTGQMHGLVLLDKANRVLRPAILWNDQRTAAQCEQMVNILGPDTLIQITGNPALTGFTTSKILWVREHEPEIFKQVAHILLPKDYVRFRLTGQYAIDCADASGTTLLDISKRDWSEEIIEAFSINRNWLPDVFEGPEITGTVTSDAAAILGIPADVPVIAGGGDQAAQAVGVGAVKEGTIALTLGTSGVVFAPTGTPYIDPQGRLHAMCHSLPPAEGQGWHLMGVMLSAGGSLRWYRDTCQPGLDYDSIVKTAAEIPPGSEGLLFLPYLTGERTPYPDPFARAGFIGLTIRHTQSHMARAVLEGVAFGLRDSLALVKQAGLGDVQQIRISGGGARSAIWRQIIADVMNIELVTVNTKEGACYGAALLAGVGTGLWSDVNLACQTTIKTMTTIQPKPENVKIYESYYQNYRALYPALKDQFKSLSTKES